MLDVSAGTGLLAENLISRHGSFKKLHLNDPSQKMLEVANYRLRHEKEVEYTNFYAEELPFDDQSFSQILCLNSFHYYTDQTVVLNHFFRMLESAGTFWILDWNRSGIFRLVNSMIKLLSKGNINTRSIGEMEELIKKAGFRIVETETWRFRFWKFFYLRGEKKSD